MSSLNLEEAREVIKDEAATQARRHFVSRRAAASYEEVRERAIAKASAVLSHVIPWVSTPLHVEEFANLYTKEYKLVRDFLQAQGTLGFGSLTNA